jgi:hypothetical protein
MFTGIAATFFGFVLKLLGSSFTSNVLGYLEKRSDNATEVVRIGAVKEEVLSQTAAGVVSAGMMHRMFWVAWSIAAIPMSAWFGYGMLATLANGALPPEASIPPGLLPYATVVWSNIFYAGAAGAVAGSFASVLASRKG